MNFSELFIRRSVATTLLMAAITMFGIFAYLSLPVSDLPNVDFPTLVVQAQLPGANPETMASAVATPLERQFSTIEGLDTMTSVNSLGTTAVTLQFSLDRTLDGAAQDVQAAITQSAPLLPPGMPTPPTFRKSNPADQPIMFLSLTTSTLPTYKLHEYADTMMAQRISMITGVAQVMIYGSQKYAVRIQVNPRALAIRGLGIDEVEAAVRRHNVNLPTGVLYGPNQMLTIQATGQLRTASEYKPLVVAYKNGAPVRLEEVATVLDSVEDDKAYSWFNSKEIQIRSIALAVLRQPGVNTVEVADRVKALMPSFQAQLPPSIQLRMMTDRSETIRESFRDVQFSMVLSLGLVVMVIFLFLRNLSATVIPSLALPISVIGTFSVMYLCGYSLNNLSMMALILAIGFVVDDAIVVLENIVRHMERGEPPMRAAFEGSREVGFTIISMTVSLAAVFIPLVFMGGLLGRLFREFAVSICVAILVSGLVSITLTPMLCSRFLRPHQGKHGFFYRITERFFDGMLHAYEATLKVALRFHWAVALLSLAILGGTVWLVGKIPKGLFPSEDISQIFAMTESAQGASHTDMARDIQVMADSLRSDPAIESFFAGIGGTSGATSATANVGRMFFQLKPRAARGETVDDVIARLRPKMNQLPGLRAFPQNPPAIRLGGSFTKGLYQYTLMGTNTDELYRTAPDLEKALIREPGLIDVSTDLFVKSPQLHVVIDRDKAAALRVTPEQIESGLYTAYGPRWVSTIYAADNQYRVLMELDRSYHADASQMTALYIRSQDGNLVPLDSVAALKPVVGPQSISHFGQLPAVTLSFNLAPGRAIGDVMGRIDELARETLPDTITTTFQGAAQVFQSSIQSLWILLALAIVVVYIVLGILYESFVHPITILSGLPSAGFGALLTLYLFDLELNIYSFVGLILLIGIVKKNAIMQIDFALEAERNEGMAPAEAIYHGCVIRFRPIMMTTMAALLGALPIAMGHGAGGEARRPLGMCIIGGLVVSQLVTLYLTPVFYIYFSRIGQLFQSRKGDAAPVIEAKPMIGAGRK